MAQRSRTLWKKGRPLGLMAMRGFDCTFNGRRGPLTAAPTCGTQNPPTTQPGHSKVETAPWTLAKNESHATCMGPTRWVRR